jgi:hypothetical protein
MPVFTVIHKRKESKVCMGKEKERKGKDSHGGGLSTLRVDRPAYLTPCKTVPLP